MTTTTETEAPTCPRQSALAADLARWDQRLPELVRAREAARKATADAREALTKAEAAETLARQNEHNETDATALKVAQHAAGSPECHAATLSHLHKVRSDLHVWQATGTGNADKIKAAQAKLADMMTLALHGVTPHAQEIHAIQESCR